MTRGQAERGGSAPGRFPQFDQFWFLVTCCQKTAISPGEHLQKTHSLLTTAGVQSRQAVFTVLPVFVSSNYLRMRDMKGLSRLCTVARPGELGLQEGPGMAAGLVHSPSTDITLLRALRNLNSTLRPHDGSMRRAPPLSRCRNWEMRSEKLNDWLAQRHTTGMSPSWDLHPGTLAPESSSIHFASQCNVCLCLWCRPVSPGRF